MVAQRAVSSSVSSTSVASLVLLLKVSAMVCWVPLCT
jgi:hypothetical protein